MLDAPTTIDTPAGPFTFVTGGGVLRAAGFTADAARLGPAGPGGRDEAIADALRRYFGGELTAIDTIPVEQAGGPFITRAWQEMRRVPAGSTVTYSELAARSGRPDAVRAAGAACASNRVALVVPCHRMLRTGGALGGYLWGLHVKRWLLGHEGAREQQLHFTEGAT